MTLACHQFVHVEFWILNICFGFFHCTGLWKTTTAQFIIIYYQVLKGSHVISTKGKTYTYLQNTFVSHFRTPWIGRTIAVAHLRMLYPMAALIRFKIMAVCLSVYLWTSGGDPLVPWRPIVSGQVLVKSKMSSPQVNLGNAIFTYVSVPSVLEFCLSS